MSTALRIAQEVRDRVSPPRHAAPVLPPGVEAWADDREEPSLAHPISQMCTQRQMEEPAFFHWCEQMGRAPETHRKLWEFAYILQVLQHHDMLREGRKGVGFGTGKEPLPAVMARSGVEVLATDLDPRRSAAQGWIGSDQHAAALTDLNAAGLCDPRRFQQNVRFEYADMNAIPTSYKDFDFCWSACCLEHLGSINAGLRFIENSLDCLRPGGLAVHTTEYNCSSNGRTVGHGASVLFRMKDMLRLGEAMRAKGHELRFNFHQGHGELDRHVDVPPYGTDRHLKLSLMRFVTTSMGIVIRKK